MEIFDLFKGRVVFTIEPSNGECSLRVKFYPEPYKIPECPISTSTIHNALPVFINRRIEAINIDRAKNPFFNFLMPIFYGIEALCDTPDMVMGGINAIYHIYMSYYAGITIEPNKFNHQRFDDKFQGCLMSYYNYFLLIAEDANNYICNWIPGKLADGILGMAFNTVLQFARQDSILADEIDLGQYIFIRTKSNQIVVFETDIKNIAIGEFQGGNRYENQTPRFNKQGEVDFGQ